NKIAAISSAIEVVPNQKEKFEERLNSGTLIGGVSHLFSTVFSSIAVVPLPATAGFVKITNQYRLKPFFIACLLLALISVSPMIVSLLASLPLPVASAALLATLIDMYKISFRSLIKQ